MRGHLAVAAAAALSLSSAPTVLARPVSLTRSIPFHISSTVDDELGSLVDLYVGEITEVICRKDVEPSQICDPARIKISGQPLPVDANGHGAGTLILDDESVALAKWNLSCVEKDGVPNSQALQMVIQSINGQEVPPTGLVGSFGSGIVDEEGGVAVEHHIATTASSASASNCRSWRCLFKSVSNRIKENIASWYPNYLSHSLSPNDTEGLDENNGDVSSSTENGDQEDVTFISRPSGGHRKQQPIKTTGTGAKPSSVQDAPSPSGSSFVSSLPPSDSPLVMSLVVASIAFGIFTLFSIGLIHHRLAAQPPHIQRRPRHRESPEERQARVESRKETVRGFFRKLFCGLFAFEEKDEEQQRQGPQGRDLRSQTAHQEEPMDSDDESTTMEQELARFREAANMVSSLIAAEEGRNNPGTRQQQPQAPMRPVPEPVSVQPSYEVPRISLEDPLLPSYETDTVDASMVADGFRFVPGGDAYTPTSPTEAGSQTNSDELGYGNKD